MQLSEKITKLRKERDLTQEQLAEQLYVSRTAISKWETGRGMPSMESLQMLAQLFSITLDELLSTEEIVIIAKNESKQSIRRFVSYIDSIINLSALLSLMLPLYKLEQGGIYYSVPLYGLGGWQGIAFWFAPIIMAVCGILQIIFILNDKESFYIATSITSAAIHVLATLLLILSAQPYPSVLFFFLLVLKGIVLLKNRR